LDLFGQLLKICTRRAAAAGATRHLRHEAADPERLQDLLRGLDLFSPVTVGLRREANANGVSDAGEQQRRKAGSGCDEALGAHASFRQS
jgi:hypothetical protein